MALAYSSNKSAWGPPKKVQKKAPLSRAKQRRPKTGGHYVYEPFTVVFLEALVTVALGVLATFCMLPVRRSVRRGSIGACGRSDGRPHGW